MHIITDQDNQPIATKAITFSGGERHVQLLNNGKPRATRLSICSTINNAEALVELFLLINALRHEYGQDIPIRVEIPYLPYARQDRVCAPGQAFSLEVIAKWLTDLKLEQLVTWDCHSQVGIDLTGAINVEPAQIIASDPAFTQQLKDKNSVLICPDKGALNRCQKIVDTLNLGSMVCCEKRRDPATGAIVRTEVLADDLSGKTAIITDDICDGGFTFIKIAEQLKALNAQRIILFVTHGIFSKGLDVFDGLIDEIYTTQSFEQQPNKMLTVINYTYNFGE